MESNNAAQYAGEDSPASRLLKRAQRDNTRDYVTFETRLQNPSTTDPLDPSVDENLLQPSTSGQNGHSQGTMKLWLKSLRPWRSLKERRGEEGSSELQKEIQDSRNMGGKKPKMGSLPRPVGGSAKLGTFDGVFVPTTLNVLSILMFLRFGFLLGQAGVVGMVGMLIVCYLINLVTTMSISAIATNGTVRGGGAYYLISRSLGPEFGGAIGIVFYLGFVFNTGMNAVGLIDCLVSNFGEAGGSSSNWLPEGYWWQYLWATIALLLCTGICLAGSGLFARCSNGLLVVLLIATISIPVSTVFLNPFSDSNLGIEYTGLSVKTFRENLMPHFTRGAAGSQIKGKETYQDLFGILFPATGGIFAGASMSGDLQNPSRSIPRGTLYGLVITFVLYTLVILAMAASISRSSMHKNLNIIQDVNASGTLVLLGEISTSLFSVLMGVIGSAKLLQALARDKLVPGLGIFGQGTKGSDGPTYAIIITYIVAQVTMLSDINQIASFVTMTYLMTFLVTNLACFLLEVSSAPNFRPSFHYFNSWTALVGTVFSGVTMFIVDGVYASVCVAILLVLFIIIHYTTTPKAWGDVSQSLIYHQVRKYLLRLRQEHVKFWRPQILLFVNNPRRSYKLIQFCNALKKGGLFMLGHVIVNPDFAAAVPEAKKQQKTWTNYIDFSKIKAFVNVGISPVIEWGLRNVVLNAGLGQLRPNIIVMGAFNLEEYRKSQYVSNIIDTKIAKQRDITPQGKKQKRRRSYDERMKGAFPTDTDRPEKAVNAKSYVTGLEDLILSLKVNVAIAKGFNELEIPPTPTSKLERFVSTLLWRQQDGNDENEKRYIDLWPIQMSASVPTKGDGDDLATTNFDTIALILQLGCILTTVPAWHRAFRLRVAVFVEYESDVEEERGRFETLLTNLRIEAEVMVFWLASGQLQKYELIVNGNRQGLQQESEKEVEDALKDEDWWQDVQEARVDGTAGSGQDQFNADDENSTPLQRHGMMLIPADLPSSSIRVATVNDNLLRNRKPSVGDYSRLGVSLTMQTHRLDPQLMTLPAAGSLSSDTNSSDESDNESTTSSSSQISLEATTGSISPAHYSEDSLLQTPSTLRRSGGSDVTSTRVIPSSSPKDPSLLSEETDTRTSSMATSSIQITLGLPSPTPHCRLSTPATPRPIMPTANLQQTIIEHDMPTSTKDDNEVTMNTPQPLRTLPRHLRPSGRPLTIRQSSVPRLSSTLVPRTTVATEEGPGPSIMFSTPSPPSRVASNPLTSIYGRYANKDTTSAKAETPPTSTYRARAASVMSTTSAFTQSQSLSFNALPCRAQHLILNELMRQHSGSSGVIFTTLPAPVAGTSESDEESLRYLGDLEVLYRGLPPMLLVHSNSVSVTMNL